MRRSAWGLGMVLLGSLALAGCGGQEAPPTEPPSSSSATPSSSSSSSSAEPSPSASSSPPAEPSPSAPTTDPRFPDPASLIGGELVEGPPGSMPTVDGVALQVPSVLGACIEGTDAEACPRMVAALQPTLPDGGTDAAHALLVLASLAGRNADGTARWTVLDAIVADLGRVTRVEYCDGSEGVVIAPSGTAGDTVTASAAWGVDGDHLVPVDPAGLSCALLTD